MSAQTAAGTRSGPACLGQGQAPSQGRPGKHGVNTRLEDGDQRLDTYPVIKQVPRTPPVGHHLGKRWSDTITTSSRSAHQWGNYTARPDKVRH